MANVTYVFTQNRKTNYETNSIQAREFYYGLPFIDKKKHKINIIEFQTPSKSYSKIINLFDEILRRFLSLPFYTSKLVNKNNFDIFKNTDHLIMVAESTGLSSFLFLVMLKKRYKINTHLFVMGLYSKKLRFPFFKKIHFAIIKLFINYLDNVFFLGQSEFNKAKKIHSNSKKFQYFPFCIDTEFWSSSDIDLKTNNQIIFVGNDGNRNVELLKAIAAKMKNFNFLFVSQINTIKTIDLPNVQVISGAWGDKKISDLNLKDLYSKSRLCILPLKNSTQPSGQSVALQCMSLGVPVLISKTDGFWDIQKFNENIEIFFAENSLDEWTEKIQDLYEDLPLLKKVALNAQTLVRKDFNLQEFNNKIQSTLKL